VTLAGVPSSNVGRTASKHPLLRRGDHSSGDPAQGGLQLGTDNAALIVEGESWLSLEDGIQIQFQPASGSTPNQYRTGDYWLIPAPHRYRKRRMAHGTKWCAFSASERCRAPLCSACAGTDLRGWRRGEHILPEGHPPIGRLSREVDQSTRRILLEQASAL